MERTTKICLQLAQNNRCMQVWRQEEQLATKHHRCCFVNYFGNYYNL